MSRHLSSKSTVLAQIKMLGKLAARLDADPRSPVDVMTDFFALSDQERWVLLDSYDGKDPIDSVVR